MHFIVYNKNLDPNLWNNQKELNPEVRNILLKIAKDYYENNEQIQGVLTDVYMVGSSANYNWTPESDLDMHLVIDVEKMEIPEEAARTLFELFSHKWNHQHDINVKGHNVELYLQSTDHELKSSGIYSLISGEWIKEPHPEKVDIDESYIKSKYRNMAFRIEKAIKDEDVDKMKKVMEDVRNIRRTGLDKSGEFSSENIVFKMLRKFGYIDRLKDATHDVYDREMTLTEKLDDKKDLVIGYVTPSLKVRSKTSAEIDGHGDFKEVGDWVSTAAWRYRRDKNMLFWWNNGLDITQDERDVVIDYLERKYGARNVTQKMLVANGREYGSESWNISHGIDENIKFKNILRESTDYDAAEDFFERRTEQLADLADLLKQSKGKGRVPWKTVPSSLLKRVWYQFGKYNRIKLNDIDKIADQILTNIARLRASTEMMGHSESDVRPELEEMGYTFTEEEWEDWMTNYFTDAKGGWMLSDYALKPLEKLYSKIFNADTPEEKLYACDKVLNIIHQRGDLAAMFVEGGSKTLMDIADQGGYVDPEEVGENINILMEAPEMETLKKNKKVLTDDEREKVMSAKAVWHHHPTSDKPTPAIWKSIVKGKTWYVCNTHRAYQAKPTLKGAIKAYKFIKTTA